jgi:hypothetical protein
MTQQSSQANERRLMFDCALTLFSIFFNVEPACRASVFVLNFDCPSSAYVPNDNTLADRRIGRDVRHAHRRPIADFRFTQRVPDSRLRIGDVPNLQSGALWANRVPSGRICNGRA